jgi:hypothetical protein
MFRYIVVKSAVPNVDDMTEQFEKDSLLPTGCDVEIHIPDGMAWWAN